MKAKMAVKVVSLILIMTMLITMTGVSAFADQEAETQDHKTVLVFGDSTSSGYGMPDFDSTHNSFNVRNNDLRTWTIEQARGHGKISDSSHPWQLKKYIVEQEFDGDYDKVDLSSMCLAGMRTNELRAMLDDDYCQRILQHEKDVIKRGVGFTTEHLHDYINALEGGGAMVGGEPVHDLAGVQAYTKEQVRKADVIVVDVCTNNFGTYLARRLAGKMEAEGFEDQFDFWKETIDHIDDISDEDKEKINTLKNYLLSAIGAGDDDILTEFVNAVLFCYASCITNITADIELIRQINPDAKIIVVGVFNSLQGIELEVGGAVVDLTIAGNMLFSTVNTYLRCLDKNADKYYYADPSDGIETFVDQLAKVDTEDELDESGRYFLDTMTSSLESMIETKFTDTQKTRARELLILVAKTKRGNLQDIIEKFQNMEQAIDEVKAYLDGGDMPSHDTMAVLQMELRFILDYGTGQHPSGNGCLQKASYVKNAYEKDQTAYQEAMTEIRAELERLYQKIMEISEPIKEAVAGKDIEELIEELKPIIEEMKKIGIAVFNLPKYEEMLDSYAEVLTKLDENAVILQNRIADLETTYGNLSTQIDDVTGQIEALKQQSGIAGDKLAKLKAKLIDVDIKSSVTFPAGKVKLAVHWDKDEDADGYRLIVNGTQKEAAATKTGYIYEDSSVGIGKTYKFEVTPYVLDKGQPVYGDTFRTAVVPKVSLKKAVLKKLKADKKSFTAKWKKVSGASGYQISYRSGGKTARKTVNGSAKASLVIKGLKKGRKYSVRVRAWKKVNGKKYYGAWSAARNVMTR